MSDWSVVLLLLSERLFNTRARHLSHHRCKTLRSFQIIIPLKKKKSINLFNLT